MGRNRALARCYPTGKTEYMGRHPGLIMRRICSARRCGLLIASLMVTAGSVPSKHKEDAGGEACVARTATIEARPAIPLVRLEIGLAGPPILGSDGRWWLLGRDGEIAHFRRDDSLAWSISVAATISGAGAADDQGLL